jgi:hypothetical protein
LFVSVLLVMVGCFNLIYGIAAIASSHVFTANAHYVFGSLRTWGWITLVMGAVQVLAAGGVLAGNQLARWFAVAVAGLSAGDQMFFIPAYPFWSLVIIAVDVVELYGLFACGGREPGRLATQSAVGCACKRLCCAPVSSRADPNRGQGAAAANRLAAARLVRDIITGNELAASRASGLLASAAVSSGVSGR